MIGKPIDTAVFFDRDPRDVAEHLIGKVLCHFVAGQWLQAAIIEAEAYLLEDRGSHASLGFTAKRKALFMAPGTIYMYFARGGDSFNVSCRGAGNAVLFKSGIPFPFPDAARAILPHETPATAGQGGRAEPDAAMLAAMHAGNPLPGGGRRPAARLCSGQTLLCKALGLRVAAWDAQPFAPGRLCLADAGYRPRGIVRTRRLGIPPGRDEHLPYRFVDQDLARFCTRNPLPAPGSRRRRPAGDYDLLPGAGAAPVEAAPDSAGSRGDIAFERLE